MVKNICIPYLRMHRFFTYDNLVMVRNPGVSTFLGKAFIFFLHKTDFYSLKNSDYLYCYLSQIKNWLLVSKFLDILVLTVKFYRENYLTYKTLNRRI